MVADELSLDLIKENSKHMTGKNRPWKYISYIFYSREQSLGSFPKEVFLKGRKNQNKNGNIMSRL